MHFTTATTRTMYPKHILTQACKAGFLPAPPSLPMYYRHAKVSRSHRKNPRPSRKFHTWSPQTAEGSQVIREREELKNHRRVCGVEAPEGKMRLNSPFARRSAKNYMTIWGNQEAVNEFTNPWFFLQENWNANFLLRSTRVHNGISEWKNE